MMPSWCKNLNAFLMKGLLSSNESPIMDRAIAFVMVVCQEILTVR